MDGKRHELHITDGRIEVGGVVEVVGYGDKEVTFLLSDRRIVITGTELRCESVDVETGRAVLSGRVNGLAYRAGASVKGLVKRLIK